MSSKLPEAETRKEQILPTSLLRCSGFSSKGVPSGHVWLPYQNEECIDKDGLTLEAALAIYPGAVQTDGDSLCNQCWGYWQYFMASQGTPIE